MTRSELLAIAQPINFNAEGARKVRSGDKTRTLRIMKSQPEPCDYRKVGRQARIKGVLVADPSVFTCDAPLCDDCTHHADSPVTTDGADCCPKHANEESMRETNLADY